MMNDNEGYQAKYKGEFRKLLPKETKDEEEQ